MNLSTLDICRSELFTAENELLAKFPPQTAERILRVRQMYMWRLSYPDAKDRQFLDEFRSRFPELGKNTAHEYLRIVNNLLPLLSERSRDFHRWRFNEMILDTYQMAKARKDTKTMERAASSYAKYNRVDMDDDQAIPYSMIVVQPFTATDDPRTLGIEPIPNIKEKIRSMIEKYRAETIDIEDIDFEEPDLELDALFPNPTPYQVTDPTPDNAGQDE